MSDSTADELSSPIRHVALEDSQQQRLGDLETSVAALESAGTATRAGRPTVDAGQNQYTYFQLSRGDVNAGTFKLAFSGETVEGETATILWADWASQGAGMIPKIEAVLGARNTDWAWWGTGGGGYPYEGTFGIQFKGAHANDRITVTCEDSTLNHGGAPGQDTLVVVDMFPGRPAEAEALTGAAGDFALDSVGQRLYGATTADGWEQVYSGLPDTPPIRFSSNDPPNDTDLVNNWQIGLVWPTYQRVNGLLFVTGCFSPCSYDGSNQATANLIATLPEGFKPLQDWHTNAYVSGCDTIKSVLLGWDAPDPTNDGGGIFPVLPAYAPGNPTFAEIIADRTTSGGGKQPTIWVVLAGVPIAPPTP